MPFPVEDKYIDESERQLGVHFPLSFRSKMKRENGGEIETDGDTWFLHPFFDNSDKNRLKRTCNDIVRETHLARQWNGFPQNGVSIAESGKWR